MKAKDWYMRIIPTERGTILLQGDKVALSKLARAIAEVLANETDVGYIHAEGEEIPVMAVSVVDQELAEEKLLAKKETMDHNRGIGGYVH